MQKFFFIDFDNTIFSHQTGGIPESAHQALSALQKDGHKFILATGRDINRTSNELSEYQLQPDGIISANGAVIEADGHILSEVYFDLALQKRLLHYIKEKDYSIVTRLNGQWCSLNQKHPLPPALNLKLLQASPEETFQKLCSAPVHAFFLKDSPEAIQDVQQHFPELRLLRMGDELGGADIVPAANNKANGIPLILDYYGASAKDAVAIGDSMNDFEMIRRAGLGIAMGNAMPEVQKNADYVAKSIDEGGLADAIRYALSEH